MHKKSFDKINITFWGPPEIYDLKSYRDKFYLFQHEFVVSKGELRFFLF